MNKFYFNEYKQDSYKCDLSYCLNTFALLPQLSNQGQLTRGPFTCQPPHTATWHHSGVHVDSRGPATCPRHLRATQAPRGLAWLCHMALHAMSHPRRSRATSARGSYGKYPLFGVFK